MKGGARWPRSMWGTTLCVAVAGGVGYYPTIRLAGAEAWGGLLAGCLVGLAAHWMGQCSLRVVGLEDPARGPIAVLTAMAVRFGAVLLLTLAAALSGWFTLGPLLTWVAISYLVALFVETLWLVQAQQHRTETDR